MRYQDSVFWQVLKHVPWGRLDRLVAQHGAEAGRAFTAQRHLKALIYGQLSGAVSLREIVTGLNSHAAQRYHLGMGKVCRSTLSEANAHRPAAVFWDLFAVLVQEASRALRRRFDGLTYLIDATPLRRNRLSQRWARFSAEVCGAKMHVIYDADADQPIYAVVSNAKRNDITAAQAMPIAPGATYVFDLGYYDFGWWHQLDQAGCRIVTRLKRNTPLRQVEERPLPAGSTVRTGLLPARLPGRQNPFVKPVREIRVKIDTGALLRIVTNDLDLPAAQIADLYKRRWAIELFFRWIKQTLRIGKFLGTSENAVPIQLAAALITFLLLRLAQAAQTAVASPPAFARLVRANLMHRRKLAELADPPMQPPINHAQLAFL